MNLLDTLFGTQRQRALGWLLLHPEQSVHVRELARLIDSSAGSLHRELAKLANAGLLLRSERGNQVLYQANRQSPIFAELAGIFRKTGGLADIVRSALQPLSSEIDLAAIFGSVARGEEQAHSDIDVLIIGKAGFASVVAALHPAQELLGREINPVVYSSAEWEKRRLQDDHFVRDILSKPRIMLIGNNDDLG